MLSVTMATNKLMRRSDVTQQEREPRRTVPARGRAADRADRREKNPYVTKSSARGAALSVAALALPRAVPVAAAGPRVGLAPRPRRMR